MHEKRDSLAAEIKAVEKEMATLSLTVKHLDVYRKTAAVYRQYLHADNKAAFRSHHESDLLLHEAARKALGTSGNNLPDRHQMLAKYRSLGQKKDLLYEKYEQCKKECREYEIIHKNLEQILHPKEKSDLEKEELTR